MKIDLLRHGETQAGRCFLGSTDALLSTKGWQQMEFVTSIHYQKIITSPLKRCADYAAYYAKKNSIPMNVDDDLREIHFGDWEAKTTDYLWKTEKKQLKAFWRDPVKNMPPNAENLRFFRSRVNLAFEKITKYENDEIEHLLLIAHGGVIRQIIANILSLSYTKAQLIRLDYAGITRVDCHDGHLSLGFINQVNN